MSRNPFQGGMGFFTYCGFSYSIHRKSLASRNPFQGGMGFFTSYGEAVTVWSKPLKSQSLSGWDGVFHQTSLQVTVKRAHFVAIPFRVGWGFSLAGVIRTLASG